MAELGTVHRPKITLRSVKPPVWRRIDVASDTNLSDLAPMLIGAMGWMGYHLHEFETRDRRRFGVPDPDDDFGVDLGPPLEDSSKFQISDVLGEGGAKVRFDYDFGDGWEHDVVPKTIETADPDTEYPGCAEGRRACPPEDCGGPAGYEDFLQALSDPTHQWHAEVTEWLGGTEFNPSAFDAAEATEIMRLPPEPLEDWL